MSPRILMVGQASQATGFARMTKGIAHSLAHQYDVHILGIDCFSAPCLDSNLGNVTLHENPHFYDVFAEVQLSKLVHELHPDIVLLFHDLWFIARYFQPLEQANYQGLLVAYCPIDGRILRSGLVAELTRLDALVVYTEFARQIVQDCAREQEVASLTPFDSIAIIPHGLDPEAFYPWPKNEPEPAKRRLLARQALFPDQPELWDGFFVLNSNRNQPRKRIDLTMRGFAYFAQDKPENVRLYLHMGMKELDVEVLRMARRLEISDRLIVTDRTHDHPSVSTDRLNLIYNACDVGVNTATGEGWGLVSCEHGLTGAPQIVPNHSACAEIWEDAAELLTPVNTVNNSLLEEQEISAMDLAEALERLYSDPTHYHKLAESGYGRMMNQAYRWPEIAILWNQLFHCITKDRQHCIKE